MEICTFPGCNKSVSRPGHKLCYEHWKATQQQKVSVAPANPSKPIIRSSFPTPVPSLLLSATKISEHLGLPMNKINPLLAELGLIDKVANGWEATRLGLNFGAVQKHDDQSGHKYVFWNPEILNNQIFIEEIVKESQSEREQSRTSEDFPGAGFRQKFKVGEYRTKDGHWVRSRAEVMIDDYLYIGGIAHAYERKLPIAEEVYCDFYIPRERVYIEYWGYDQNPDYLARKKDKQHIYKQYNFNSIELSDEDIKNLDDSLPQKLRVFGITVD